MYGVKFAQNFSPPPAVLNAHSLILYNKCTQCFTPHVNLMNWACGLYTASGAGSAPPVATGGQQEACRTTRSGSLQVVSRMVHVEAVKPCIALQWNSWRPLHSEFTWLYDCLYWNICIHSWRRFCQQEYTFFLFSMAFHSSQLYGKFTTMFYLHNQIFLLKKNRF